VNLTNLSLRLSGYPIAAAKSKLQQLQAELERDYSAYAETKKAEILEHHLSKNPFYQDLAGKFTDWDSLPVLTKSDLQQPLKNRLALGISEKNIHKHKTSGSSGNPFIFAKDKFAHALTWASIQDLYTGLGIDIALPEARFYGIPKSGVEHYKERFKDVLGNRYRFPIFNTSSENFENFIRHFKTKKYGYLNGYTSSLVLFARFLAEKGVILKEICPSLTHCIVTAEMLFPEDLQLLENQFGIPIINEYGASETGIIAIGKASGSLKIDSRLIYVEILDEHNRPVAEGVSGKIVITALFNKAHPFIRYELGDLGTLNFKDGLPVLSKLEGRIGDYALLPDGKKIPALAFYYVTKEIISDTGSVKEFVINQSKPDRFEVEYVADKAFAEAEIQKIKRALLHYFGQDVTIKIERKTNLDRSTRGKLKQFTRSF
tara:strand:- start:11623 stop:12915 length:1293 start_codon:yes stop_codon:yes gene_type:complete